MVMRKLEDQLKVSSEDEDVGDGESEVNNV